MLRKEVLAGIAAALASPAESPFAGIERVRGVVLGVCAVDTGSGATLMWRAREHFPLASTQKLPLVMATLARVDAGRERLDRPVRIRRQERVAYSPVVGRYPDGATLSIAALCRAAISRSDNTAADMLARELGGPAATTAFLRRIGVRGIRVDRYERELPPRALRGDARDGGTPESMARLVARLISGPPLSAENTARLLGWMRATTTGTARLRAGVPLGWTVADKTGTYANAANDVGLLFPPAGGAPLAVAVFVFGGPDGEREPAIADAARVLSRQERRR